MNRYICVITPYYNENLKMGKHWWSVIKEEGLSVTGYGIVWGIGHPLWRLHAESKGWDVECIRCGYRKVTE